MKLRNIMWLAVFVIFLQACATGRYSEPEFIINIDSISSENYVHNKKYILLPGTKEVSPRDLQFQEYANYLIRVLHPKGYRLSSVEDADLVIFLQYGIGEPEEYTKNFVVPIFGQTGIASSHLYGNTSFIGNTANFSGTAINTPRYGVRGFVPSRREYVLYNRYVSITAFDRRAFAESEEVIQVWETSITSRGASDDLRRVFPIMIATAFPYISENTGQKVKLRVKESADFVSL